MSSSNFQEVFYNGYTNTSRSILEQKTADSFNEDLSKAFNKNKIPACHLNFSNIGTMDFDFLNFTAKPVNYKLFEKIERMSVDIRGINSKIIGLIDELKCCDIADMYNRSVIPILEWLLTDFLKVITQMAEGIIIGYQAFKIVACIVRPVPGNPWMGAGGIDWLSSIYSYLNGFEAIYKWIMDGNPLDIIVNPIHDIYNKIGSCTPSEKEFDSITSIQDDRLKALLKSYDAIKDEKIDRAEQLRRDGIRTEYFKAKEDRSDVFRRISLVQRELDILDMPSDLSESEKSAKRVEYAADLNSLSTELFNTESDYKKKLAKYQKLESVINKTVSKHLQSQNRINSTQIVGTQLTNLMLGNYNSSCSCISGMLNISSYRPPKFKTLHTKDDVTALRDDIHYSDKNKLSDTSPKQLGNLFLTYDNIDQKYADNNSDIDRDNAITAQIFIDGVFAVDYEDTLIDYNYIDYNGVREDDEFQATTDPIMGQFSELYKDTGKTTHTANKITDIFILNGKRQQEKSRILLEQSRLESEQYHIERTLENIWNVLRRNAIEKIRYLKFMEAKDEEYAWYDSAVFHKAIYSAGVFDSIEAIEGQALLEKLGTSFEIVSFMNRFNADSTADIESYINTNSPSYDPAYVVEDLYDIYDTTNGQHVYIGNFQELKANWALLSKDIGKLRGGVKRLENLILLDNVVISVIDKSPMECSCTIICKLIQWVLDYILSSVTGLVTLIIERLLKATMNEHIAYILDFIIHQLQCAADIGAFTQNVKDVKDRADLIIESNKRPLTLMEEQSYCIAKKDDGEKLSDKLKEDEVVFNSQELTPPMPTFGEDENYAPQEPGNIIISYGATITPDDETSTSDNGTHNIQEVALFCDGTKFPCVEVSIEERSQFEIMVVFKPSNNILNADIIEIQQIPEETTITTPDGTVVDTTSVIVNDISDIMNKVNAELQRVANNPAIVDTDCTDTTTSNDLSLCSTDDLYVYSFNLIDSNEDPYISTPGVFTAEGNLSAVKFAGTDEYEYWPEHENVDENGMVKITENQQMWTYTVPAATTNASSTTDTLIVTTNDLEIQDHVEIQDAFEFINDERYDYHTVYTYTYYMDGIDRKEKLVTVATTTVTTFFHYPDLSILIQFRNRVNRLNTRLILDVGDPDYSFAPYNIDTYNGQYSVAAELGQMNSTKISSYNISIARIRSVCGNILKSNYMVSDKDTIAAKVEIQKFVETDPCLLPEDQKSEIQRASAFVESVQTIADDTIDSITQVTDTIDAPEPSTEVPMVVQPLRESIPFMVLNKEEDLMVQIVDRKMYFQFKTSTLLNAEPTIIDYELQPNEIYMFSFNTNGLIYNMSLITPDKVIYEASGINMQGIDLQPSIIGGNADKSKSFCGNIIDVIISKTGGNTIDFYKRTLMGYVPRTSSVLFDFSVHKGNRVYNTINNFDNTFINNANAINDQFLNPTILASQKASMSGEVVTTKFYRYLKNGYLDNFFCKDNLQKQDFTLSAWFYYKDEGYIGNANRQILFSDDINKNYVYYNSVDSRIIMEFDGEYEIIPFVFTQWTQIVLRRSLYIAKYELIIADKDNHIVRELISSNVFSLMSIGSEYHYKSKRYINTFPGYLSTISIFMEPISDKLFNILHREQFRLVRGSEGENT